MTPSPTNDASSSWELSGPERLYVITGGRGTSGRRADVDLVTLVVARAAARPEMQPEHASILRMCHYPLSVAEISAYLRLPFSVVTILISDLLADSSVEVRATVHTAGIPDRELLEAVMYGLQKL
ncbi:DUF742 domain-containing protein [Frankia sp. AgB1.9]|uniref:DUF742 domain-containing protein n=1 Tax=unclassified Frankia TaxID=2632575 RepID=UPI001931E260|nr:MULTISPECIES: DUF742 domain-containing protein [unclassified Frankia]MBL7490803.1 DUF742 domain-containing protein [Frankia sp. AgW1.1]MBL7552240.1 DUF742 domain-containing protein [Frankia sp. AgB1.9]MBL7622001.1 DUF742 domain-containing protein [Frankia sp. AgB1.8]